jgi:dipeptidyl aminopeptidase/acylaminoacyl peptidase
MIGEQLVGLSEARFNENEICWLESRPQENGRSVVVCRQGSGAGPQEITPKFEASHDYFNVRTGAHSYGGGAWVFSSGVLYFSNYSDGRLYRQSGIGAAPVPLTPPAPLPPTPSRDFQRKYADGVIDRVRKRWIGICEDHTNPKTNHPDNRIVAVNIDGPKLDPGLILASGHDFYSSPCLSPDSDRLAWLAWDHPNMPWTSSTLYIGDLDDAGLPTDDRTAIAGGVAESIFQPQWAADGSALYFISDRTGWWNLYAYDLAKKSSRALAPKSAEFGQAQWTFGMSTYAPLGRSQLVAAYIENGLGRLALIDTVGGTFTDLSSKFNLPYTEFSSVRSDGADRVVFRAGAPNIPASIVLLHLSSGRNEILKKSTDVSESPKINRYFSKAKPVSFSTANGDKAFGLYYAPTNPDYRPPRGEKPPLVVKCHGGPTAAASTTLELKIQYWTSRGIAVLDVNYGGSAGYGRAYRDRLHLRWGIVDVDDCVNGAKHLAKLGKADKRRSVISGGSAGGYTTLAALTFRKYFQGGASYYGISDISALAKDTHKFEAHYLDWLIGPYPKARARYRARSPVFHTRLLSKPIIFFQGEKDRVVPRNQTDKMVKALRRQGTPVGYLLFADEDHGFRKSENIQRAIDAELLFYSLEVFRVELSY